MAAPTPQPTFADKLAQRLGHTQPAPSALSGLERRRRFRAAERAEAKRLLPARRLAALRRRNTLPSARETFALRMLRTSMAEAD